MLTVAYCRVSTTEQAEEGSSIDGQTERLRAYAELHDLIAEGPNPADLGCEGVQVPRPST